MANNVYRFFSETSAHAAFKLLNVLPQTPGKTSFTSDANAARTVSRCGQLKQGDRGLAQSTYEVGNLTFDAGHTLMNHLHTLAGTLISTIRADNADYSVTVTTLIRT